MPSIVGKKIRVVEGDGLFIDELLGNVASDSDRLSVAVVSATKNTCEPWLTLHYDEWMCVLSGTLVLLQEGQPDLHVQEGETVYIEPNTRFKPTFPVDTKYIPICIPAFRPDRCIREDVTEDQQRIGANLKSLHGDDDVIAAKDENVETRTSTNLTDRPEILYHMTTKAQWETAQNEQSAYYPTTFEDDGYYTHATGVPSRLITTANHFYQDVPGDWICLEFTRTALFKSGIYVRDEQALPVGNQEVSGDWSEWVCPHVLGGIPLSVVRKKYPMIREGKTFLTIVGLL